MPQTVDVVEPAFDDAAVSDATRIGTVLDGRFELHRALGAGGAGTLWVATDRKTGDEVAVKMLHRSLRASPRAVERMTREADVLTRLSHPNIAKAIAFAAHRDAAYMVMELVAGQNLLETIHQHVDRRTTIQPKMVAQVAVSLGRALQHAHDEGVVHRDVKPANIMIEPEGTPKLLDFGIARLDAVAADRATTAGRLLGTYSYMSPEQTLGLFEITGASDQFGLAVVLFELLTMRRPWLVGEDGEPLAFSASPTDSNNSALDRRERILDGPRPLVSKFVPEFARVDEVLVRALSRRPEDRYERIEAFTSSLSAAVLASPMPTVVLAASTRGSTEARPSDVESEPPVAETLIDPPAVAVPRRPVWIAWTSAMILAGLSASVAWYAASSQTEPTAQRVLIRSAPEVEPVVVESSPAIAPDPKVETPAAPPPEPVEEPPARRSATKVPPATAPPPQSELRQRLSALRKTPRDLEAVRRLAAALEAEAARSKSATVENRVRRLVRSAEATADLDGFEAAIVTLESAASKRQ